MMVGGQRLDLVHLFYFAILLAWVASPHPVLAQEAFSPLDSVEEDAPAGPTNALDKKDFEFYLRHLYILSPEVTVQIGDFKPSLIEGLLETTVRMSNRFQSRDRLFYVSKDGRKIVEGVTREISKNPFHKNLEAMDNRGKPGFGKQGAPVVIAAFSDFQCPYCAKEAKLLRTQVAEAYPEQVRVYFYDFPLPMHKWAKDAAVAGQCIYRMEPEAFWKYHDWIFEQQSKLTPENLADKIGEFAAAAGLDSLKLMPCIDGRNTEEVVQASIKTGRAIGVSSTPTIFLNGRLLKGSLPWEKLKAIIDHEIEYQKVTKNAGDDCGCEIEVAFPGQQ